MSAVASHGTATGAEEEARRKAEQPVLFEF